MLNRRLVLLGAITVLSLIIAGVGYSVLTNPPETEPAPETRSPALQPPQEIKPPTEQPPPSLEQKIEGFKKEIQAASAAGKSSQVTFTITEDEANSKVAPLLAKAEILEDVPLQIKNIQFDFQPERVVTTVTATIYGLTMATSVTARVNIRDGKPEAEIADIDFGWLPLPEFIKNQITGLITQEIEDLQTKTLDTAITSMGNVDWSITDIDIQEERVTVTLIIQPKTAID